MSRGSVGAVAPFTTPAHALVRSVYMATAAHARPERAGARRGARRLHSTDARRSPRVGWTKSHQKPTASGAALVRHRPSTCGCASDRTAWAPLGAVKSLESTRPMVNRRACSVVVSRRHRLSQCPRNRGLVGLTARRNYSVRVARSSDAESAREAAESSKPRPEPRVSRSKIFFLLS